MDRCNYLGLAGGAVATRVRELVNRTDVCALTDAMAGGVLAPLESRARDRVKRADGMHATMAARVWIAATAASGQRRGPGPVFVLAASNLFRKAA